MTERKLFAHELAARLDELLLLKLRQRSAAPAAALLEALPRQHQECFLHWVGVAAQSANELGWLIASLGAVQAVELGAQFEADFEAQFDSWVRAGLAAHDHGGLDAAREALTLATSELRHNAGRLTQGEGVAFAAVEGRLALFLQALHGRPLR
ncbi:MAG: hypothetical protein Q8J99_13845, partial [Sulfuritalea sp.]|nr:hypothetical protein [Sulfuritalea sp.]